MPKPDYFSATLSATFCATFPGSVMGHIIPNLTRRVRLRPALLGSVRMWLLNGEVAGLSGIAARALGDFGNVNGEQLDERGVISDGNLNVRLVVEF